MLQLNPEKRPTTDELIDSTMIRTSSDSSKPTERTQNVTDSLKVNKR
jgi:hypothetical protein